MNDFGQYIRQARLGQSVDGRSLSVRRLAKQVGIEPSYLSKIERGLESPPGEETIIKMAVELGEDPDVLLALAGKVSSGLQAIIRQRPQLFAKIIRELKKMPDQALLRIVREVRDGHW